MKKAVIFDADGTLFDSYKAIVEVLLIVCKNHSISYSFEQIIKIILDTDSKTFLKKLAFEYQLDFDKLVDERRRLPENINEITLMPNAKEMLHTLNKKGVKVFIYTHRGISTKDILSLHDIEKYFTEVIDSSYGFNRKPDPEAINYLIQKYELDKENTYYVGDRRLDIEVSNNAGINSIFYNSANLTFELKANYEITDLNDVVKIVEN